MTGASLSPDGTHVAFLSSLDGRYQVVIEQFKPGFHRYILPPGDDSDFEWVAWASDDRLLVSASFSAHRYLTETTETRLFSVGPRGQNLTAIIRPSRRKETGSRVARELPPAQLQDDVVDWLPGDLDHVLVALDADQNGAVEVRRVNVNDGSYEIEATDFAGYSSWITDQAGDLRIAWRHDFKKDRLVLHWRDRESNWRELRDAAWMLAGFTPLAFSNDPDVIYARGRNDDGMAVIRTVDIATGNFLETIFENGLYDVGSLLLSDVDARPIGVSFNEHLTKVSYFDDRYARLQKVIDGAMPETVNRIASTSSSMRQVLIYSYSDTNLGAYSIWDRDEGSLSHYSDRIPAVNAGLLSPVIDIAYVARDGLRIPGYLTVPTGKKTESLPTIVLPHGGPATRDNKSYWFLSQFLAARGYAVLQPNFRGSSGYGRAFLDAGNSEWGGKMQDDISDGAQWLISEGIADPERLCIVGWPYGGYAAAMGLIKTPDLFRCGVSINGVLNLPRLILDDQNYVGGDEWTKSMGLDGESAKTVSPQHQAEKITAPLLVIQSADDARVHKDQGRRMFKRMQRLGKEVEYGGHSMLNVAGRIKILQAVDAFLAQHIGR
jgi:dipeptidyl aminopeptidase/acylaminoacyl peptidase